jgi:DNA-binding transcriptional MerR regulator
MSEPLAEIPNRALFKAAEVCEIARLQPYVLRSWESEFPELGVQKAGGGSRVYRRADVERVLRIKHLLLVDGLTLAGVRRKLESEAAPVAEDVPLDDLLGRNARERIVGVKNGLRSLLDLLSAERAGSLGDYELTPPVIRAVGPRPMADRAKAAAAKFGGARKAASSKRPAKRPSKPAKPASRGKRKHASA